MFQTAIGRIQSTIESPPRTLEMQVFLDAGGKAGNQRVWGGLSTIGDVEIKWIKQVLNDIGEYSNGRKELKGREIETSIIKAVGRKIINEDRRILFWANWLLDPKDQTSINLAEILRDTLNSMKPNPYNLKRQSIQTWHNAISHYFSRLKPVNQHKLLSIISHVQWLFAELKRAELGRQLKSVKFIIDKENFPNESTCGIVLKSFLAAGLQDAAQWGRAKLKYCNYL